MNEIKDNLTKNVKKEISSLESEYFCETSSSTIPEGLNNEIEQTKSNYSETK